MRVKAWCQKPESITKSLASLASAAVYEFMCDGIPDAPLKLNAFFAKECVTIVKQDKKTGRDIEKDIRPLMISFRIVKDMRGRMLAEATLSAAPGQSLGPSAFFEAFCVASGLDAGHFAPVITRTRILGVDGKLLTDKLVVCNA
jgi:hypothetical protein